MHGPHDRWHNFVVEHSADGLKLELIAAVKKHHNHLHGLTLCQLGGNLHIVHSLLWGFGVLGTLLEFLDCSSIDEANIVDREPERLEYGELSFCIVSPQSRIDGQHVLHKPVLPVVFTRTNLMVADDSIELVPRHLIVPPMAHFVW